MQIPYNAPEIDYRVSPEGRVRAALYGAVCLTAAAVGFFIVAASAVGGAASPATWATVAIGAAFALQFSNLSVRFFRDAFSREARVRIRRAGLVAPGIVRNTTVRWDQLVSHRCVPFRGIRYSLHILRFRKGPDRVKRVLYLPDTDGLSPDSLHLELAIALRRGKSSAEIRALTNLAFPQGADAEKWNEQRHGGIRGV